MSKSEKYFESAKKYYKQGNYAFALKYLSKMESRAKREKTTLKADWWHLKGDVLEAQKSRKEALECYKKARDLGDEVAKAIAAKLGLELVDDFQRLQKNDSTLTSLNLGYSQIDDEGAKILAKIIAKNTMLTSLYLRNNQIGVEGAKALAEALGTNTTLTMLSLMENSISDIGTKELAQALLKNKTLTWLNIYGNLVGIEGAKALAEVVSKNTTLTSLIIEDNHLSDAGVIGLAEAMTQNTTLTELNLSWNRITVKGIQSLTQMQIKNTTLTTLHLNSNQIGLDGIKMIADMLEQNKTLTTLHLSSNQLGEAGTKILANALTKNKTLTSLHLNFNNMENAGAKIWAETLLQNTSLRELGLKDNQIGAEGAKALAASLAENTTLTLLALGNNQINDTLNDVIENLLSRNRKFATNLQAAVQQGNLNQIQTLIVDKKLSVNLQGDKGLSLAHIAAQNGHIEVAAWLLNKGANFQAKDNNGNTPLQLAKQQNQKAMVEWLEHVPNFGSKSHEGTVVISQVEQVPLGIKLPIASNQQVGLSPSVMSSSENKPLDKNLNRPTSKAAAPRVSKFSTASLPRSSLKKQPSSITIGMSSTNSNSSKLNPKDQLLAAAQKGDIQTIRRLLDDNVDADVRNREQKTALHLAVLSNNLEAVFAFIEAGVAIDSQDQEGKTPLGLAVENGFIEIAELLEAEGADLGHRDKQGNTLLMLAAIKGQLEPIKWLTSMGAAITDKNNQDHTAQTLATRNKHKAIIEYLKSLRGGGSIYVSTSTSSNDSSIDNFIASPRPISEPNNSMSPPVSDSAPLAPAPLANTAPPALSANVRSKSKMPLIGEAGTIELSLTIPSHELKLGNELGKGGFGIVHEGTWQYNSVAIKTLLAHRLSEALLAEFKQEAGMMISLQHPNIVRMYGITLDQTPYCMVMEFMSNGSLYGYLHSNKPLEWPIRLQIAEDITKGLAHLHNKNILHRDLKSLNVLLDKNMQAKLADFGLAKLKKETSSTTTTNQSVGTLRWMAPELFRRGAVYNFACDMYSYAMTIWELTSRLRPFEDAENDAIAKEWIRDGEREKIPEDCPAYLGQVIELCWHSDATRRPSAAKALEMLKMQPATSADAHGPARNQDNMSRPNLSGNFRGGYSSGFFNPNEQRGNESYQSYNNAYFNNN